MVSNETRAERRRLQRRYPKAFTDGMRTGAGVKHTYPSGFDQWELDRRNAWWAGANLGYLMAHPESVGEVDNG